MEKRELLNSIFDTLIEDLKLEKEDLILSVEKNEYNIKKYKNCSRMKTIVAHMFFMAILKHSPSTSKFVNERDPFIEYIRWNSVFVRPIEKCILPDLQNSKQKRLSKKIHSQIIKSQAKKLFMDSLNNLNAAKLLKTNEFFSQSVHYSQMAAEIGIKSVLKANNVLHTSWKCEHSLINLGNFTKCVDKKFFNLCYALESLGLNEWKNIIFEKSSTLSIRSRYCDYDDNAFLYVDTMPSKVFNCKLAKKAYLLSENILYFCEELLDKTWSVK